ncbi:hypothetical protein D9619_005737 [Psilocybe cf. subviscida]|uniref:NADP-dependent oxidoreductase domain-containing protein n=1 Tax=Psilocybe cf. subviscida TaxID=2480587 RepID=A0A8H5FB76_9AGAR|nr:hypothetical protein D9619_005737 [Psilocybe cf. subviscida]
MSTAVQKSALNVVMGAMTFGAPGTMGSRVHDLTDVEEILNVFKSHGHTEIDTARVYAGGTSEEYLGKLDLPAKGFKIETKLYPFKLGKSPITHDEEGIRTNVRKSLEALNVSSLEMWYLHGPDRTVPYEVTLKVVNDLYKEGLFKRFGISNYMSYVETFFALSMKAKWFTFSWEVAEIVGICKANGYIQPTVYQGIYNSIQRGVEPELLPCLRKFGISFYEFNPLGGGFFTGRYKSIDDVVEEGSRFDDSELQGKMYRARYWKEPYFKALASVKDVAEKHHLTMPEVALRWMTHHSQLKREYGDSILIGASSLPHIKQNLIDLEKGPLPDEVVKTLDEAWTSVQPFAANYWH